MIRPTPITILALIIGWWFGWWEISRLAVPSAYALVLPSTPISQSQPRVACRQHRIPLLAALPNSVTPADTPTGHATSKFIDAIDNKRKVNEAAVAIGAAGAGGALLGGSIIFTRRKKKEESLVEDGEAKFNDIMSLDKEEENLQINLNEKEIEAAALTVSSRNHQTKTAEEDTVSLDEGAVATKTAFEHEESVKLGIDLADTNQEQIHEIASTSIVLAKTDDVEGSDIKLTKPEEEGSIATYASDILKPVLALVGLVEAEKKDQKETNSTAASLEALENMQYCYKATFFGVSADIFESFLQGDFSTEPLKLVDCLNFIDDLGLLGFGVAIYRMTFVMQELKETCRYLRQEALLRMFSIMKRVWFFATASLVISSMATVAGVSELGPEIFAALALGGLVILTVQSDEYTDKSIINSRPSASLVLEAARSEGNATTRNMLLCSGAFILYGLAQFIDIVTSSDYSLFDRVIGLPDVLEEGTIANLLLTLRAATLPIVIDLTARERLSNDESYIKLYEATTKMYRQSGETIFNASLFPLLAVIYSKIVSPILGLE